MRVFGKEMGTQGLRQAGRYQLEYLPEISLTHDRTMCEASVCGKPAEPLLGNCVPMLYEGLGTFLRRTGGAMGGFNSGRRATTPDTDDCLELSLSYLRRLAMLRREQWSQREMRWTRYGGRQTVGVLTIVADIDCFGPEPCLRLTGWAFGQHINQRLELVSQAQPFGGERFYARCPITGGRCTVLFLPPNKSHFASARGWGVPYASTREREVDRAYRTIHKIESQSRTRSKYTRHCTRERTGERYARAYETVGAYEERLMQAW